MNSFPCKRCLWSTIFFFFYIPGKSALVAHHDRSEHCDVMASLEMRGKRDAMFWQRLFPCDRISICNLTRDFVQAQPIRFRMRHMSFIKMENSEVLLPRLGCTVEQFPQEFYLKLFILLEIYEPTPEQKKICY